MYIDVSSLCDINSLSRVQNERLNISQVKMYSNRRMVRPDKYMFEINFNHHHSRSQDTPPFKLVLEINVKFVLKGGEKKKKNENLGESFASDLTLF